MHSVKTRIADALTRLRRKTGTPRTSATITPEHVIWAYRLFLDREPENDTVVLSKARMLPTTQELRRDFMNSPEFKQNAVALPFTEHGTVIIKEIEPGLRLFLDLSDHDIGVNMLLGLYEEAELAFVRKIVQPRQTVIDLGANIGIFSMTMANLVGSSGKVYAFEPLKRNADLLARSIIENRYEDRVVLERAAAGETSGASELIRPHGTTNWGGPYLRRSAMPIPAGHAADTVPLISLDDYLFQQPVSFVKLDIEGAEPLALRGARRILRRDRPTILAEINPAQLQTVSCCTANDFITEMQTYGYDCHALDNGTIGPIIAAYAGSDITNVVFVPRP